MRNVVDTFDTRAGRTYRKGEAIAQGFTDTGDHVFVDKISYHFRKPQRGEVFVFDTRKLGTIERQRNPQSNTQYYIKRLVGVGNDELRVAPPQLFINGQLASEPGYQRVMTGTFARAEGRIPRLFQSHAETRTARNSVILGTPSATTKVPDRHYWAMGDNSYQSSDSRDWGPVPPTNLMGTGVFVYWPFSRDAGGRWGFIK